MRDKRKKGRREWVKNALIIFLAVMLVLTFFSNTIMNYSLPEVAAQYPTSAAITTKIRGTGTVEASQSYNVTVSETRTVASVNVKAGDTIQAGQVLLTLDETDSQELKDARSVYESLKLEYDKMLLLPDSASNADSAALQQLESAVTDAQSDLTAAKAYEESLAWYLSQEASAQKDVDSKQATLNTANTNLALLQSEQSNMATGNAEYIAAQQRVDKAQAAFDAALAAGEDTTDCQLELDDAIASRDAFTLDIGQRVAAADQAVINAQSALTTAQNTLSAAQAATAQFQSENSDVMSVSSAEAVLKSAQDALSSAKAAAADEAVQEGYDSAVAALDQADLERRLKEAEETVTALEESAAAAEIISRYGGVVREVNVAAGDTTSAEMNLMVVELTEKGYTLTATVSKKQAKTLREGLTAEITNLWDSGITMTLSSITTDKNDPTNSCVLTFTVEGEDVTVGETISFSVGDKNANYDVVLPTSAIHSDADGSFVYTVSVKSSPLGNRYTVKKKTVSILASDDVNSAVSGELSTADFVVTTATVPIEVGDQVRIAE